MLLETRGIVKKFKGLIAINHVDIVINEGEILSIIGPNGAGKTTFFNLITGILPCEEGSFFYRGEEITGLPPYDIAAKGIIRTFQTTKIFSQITVLQSTMIGRHLKTKSGLFASVFRTKQMKEEEKVTRQKALEILEFMDMITKQDFICKNLPYGEQRKLEIAIALAAEPDLLLLDEPSIGMNPEETSHLMTLIKKIRHLGTTVTLVEHDMNVVMNISDRIVVLDFGQKIAEGLPDEIKENQKVIKVYLGEEIYGAEDK
jgi:branched-chain amino acid transport system ATP-binding protein